MKIWIEKYKAIIIGGCVILFAGFLYFSQPDDQAFSDFSNIPLQTPEINASNPDKDEESLSIFVDVKGAVRLPGLYEAEEGDRVFDLIELAGGLLDEADEDRINLAEKAFDEMVVYIAKKGEVFEDMTFPTHSSEKTPGKVNLNKADAAELETLSGIGPSKAKAIIEYREQNGPYKQIEDLKKISGIGEKTFEKLQDTISVK